MKKNNQKIDSKEISILFGFSLLFILVGFYILTLVQNTFGIPDLKFVIMGLLSLLLLGSGITLFLGLTFYFTPIIVINAISKKFNLSPTSGKRGLIYISVVFSILLFIGIVLGLLS